MSKMNELAEALDDLASAASQLKTCALDLVRAAVLLRDTLTVPDGDEPAAEKEKTAPKPRRPRAEHKPEPAPDPASESTPEPEPAPEPDPPQYTKVQVRQMLSDLAGRGHKEEAKALVARYADGGSFSDIDPARYPELAEEVKRLA